MEHNGKLIFVILIFPLQSLFKERSTCCSKIALHADHKMTLLLLGAVVEF